MTSTRQGPVVGAPEHPHSVAECSRTDAALARAFQFLGKRWNAAVLGSLSHGPAGFREISRSIERISDSVLSNRLTALTEAGLISRTVDPGPPVSVTYALTGRGAALMPAFAQISAWAEEHLPD
ncbi:winged helix-turn-helix transcriptional regulator [Jidongwangia harbinensis]|uniref:winged helix-turn-helix transcriptional regulator n=1 Tax=Jidongwangia harbinensis TaxID=2878561 RepID=UPI001CDA276C|nr:helix-turn-helix domain-containing protein [Jidongwangia harbinensis]MCA2215749.1 helix-turn-helix transcriptional regulator [Jidongwangia harbinensis]